MWFRQSLWRNTHYIYMRKLERKIQLSCVFLYLSWVKYSLKTYLPSTFVIFKYTKIFFVNLVFLIFYYQEVIYLILHLVFSIKISYLRFINIKNLLKRKQSY